MCSHICGVHCIVITDEQIMRTCECLCLVCGKESGNLHDATTTTSTADLQNVVVSINLTVYYYARGFKSISDGYSRVKSMFFCGPFPQRSTVQRSTVVGNIGFGQPILQHFSFPPVFCMFFFDCFSSFT